MQKDTATSQEYQRSILAWTGHQLNGHKDAEASQDSKLY